MFDPETPYTGSCWNPHGELRHDLASCPSLGTRSPVQAVRPWGNFSCCSQRRPAHATFELWLNQLLHVTSGCAGNIGGTIDGVVRSVRAS